jgi:hypothetical protein
VYARIDRRIDCQPALPLSYLAVPLFLQEINSERCSFAAGILDRGRAGKQNNSGAIANVTQPIYLLRIFAKIAS